MASFLDTIPQFTPYIQQQPVEQMVQVGMEKQKRYDEGLQKIQGQIENVAGLDISKPLHKEYLNSKLNELGGKLKTVAGGDFSNYQLVNSVAGMTTQIVKDPVIRNAVVSTQLVRQGEKELQAAKTSGKNSIQNEEWWGKTKSDWFNDNDLNSSFNGKYVEYTDMEKKLREVAKEVNEYDNTVEIPFLRNNKGETLYFYKDANGKQAVTTDPSKGGQSRIDQAVLKTRVKGKSAEKILENFYSSIDPNDMQQLKIDGWYHYRGVSGEAFKNRVKKDIAITYDKKKKFAEEELANLTVELASNTNLTSEQKLVKENLINSYTALLNKGELQQNLNAQLASVDTTDELSLKQSVYTENYLNTLAENISYQNRETEYKDNPYWKAMMDTKDLEFKYWNANREQQNENRKIAISAATSNREERKFQYEISKNLLEKEGPSKIYEALGTVTEGKEIPTLELINAGIKSTKSELNDFIVSEQNLLIPTAKNQTPEQKVAAMDKLLDQYMMNPSSFFGDNNKILALEKYRVMKTDLTRQISTHLNIKNKSEERYGKKLTAELGNVKGLTLAGGEQLYSGQELITEFDKLKSFRKVVSSGKAEGGPLGGGGMNVIFDKEGIINAYKGTKYEPIAMAYIKSNTGQPLTATEKVILNKTTQVYNDYKGKVDTLLTEKKKFESEQVGKVLPQYQMKVTSYKNDDKTDKLAIDNVIGNMYGLYDTLSSLDTEKFNPDVISTWKKDNEDLKYLLVKSEDNSGGKFVVQKGKEVQEIPLNAEQLAKYFPNETKVNWLDLAKARTESTYNKTTNAADVIGDSPTNAINAAYSGDLIPNFQGTGLASQVRFDVEGAKSNTGAPGGLYQIRMYVLDDNGNWKSDVVNKAGFTTLGGVNEVVREIGVTKYLEIKNKK